MDRDETISAKFQKNTQKHAELLRFFALLISGTAIGLIFNAICGYEYSQALVERVRLCFSPPFDGVSGFFGIFGVVTDAAGTDMILTLLVCLFGLTYITRQGCSLLLMLRGVFLGLSAGILAVSAAGGVIDTPHPALCSVLNLLFASVTSVILVFLSCFAGRASTLFRGLSDRSPNMIFTARFGTYCLAFAAAIGAEIILKAIYLLFIYLLTL